MNHFDHQSIKKELLSLGFTMQSSSTYPIFFYRNLATFRNAYRGRVGYAIISKGKMRRCTHQKNLIPTIVKYMSYEKI